MKVAALDIGSNTIICLIAEKDQDGNLKVLEDQTEVVRLGQGLAQSGKIADAALERAEKCLTRFAGIIQKHKPDATLAVATAATRKASNGSEVVAIAERLGIPIKVISGIEEAELTFKGTISHLKNSHQPKLIIDIGGASTEIICGTLESGITFKKSFEVGVVKLKEALVQEYPLPSTTLSHLHLEIEKTFSELMRSSLLNGSCEALGSPWDAIAVAGTPTTLAAAVLGRFDVEKIEGFEFTRSELEEWKNRLAPLTPDQIEENYKVTKGRSDVLCIGVMILAGVMKTLNIQKLKVSTRGLRFGVAQTLLNEK